MPLAPDIARRIELDFGAQAAVALDLLEDLSDLGLSKRENARVVRCVVHLAHGDMGRLRAYRIVALDDYRDAIWWAEYEGGEVRLRDLARPFE